MTPTQRPTKPSAKAATSERAGRDMRLVARVSSEEKALLQRAAEHQGQSLSAYVIEKARAAAMADLEEAGEVVLASRDQRLFVNLLLNPPRANARLGAAIEAAEALARRR